MEVDRCILPPPWRMNAKRLSQSRKTILNDKSYLNLRYDYFFGSFGPYRVGADVLEESRESA
jgi:hypothetical protein